MFPIFAPLIIIVAHLHLPPSCTLAVVVIDKGGDLLKHAVSNGCCVYSSTTPSEDCRHAATSQVSFQLWQELRLRVD